MAIDLKGFDTAGFDFEQRKVKSYASPVVVHDTQFYRVQIGTSIHGTPPCDVYQILNKQYNIIESEYTELPNAIIKANDMDAYLAHHMDRELGITDEGGGELQ
jgi:hypothetical protein